ncbi:ATP-dependent RNA helicase SKI2 [Abeliophyllum distichum]|uniref:ATP-dependent RNA helicase SKI2 n=1 Tax=Abeliophyllum distichum TaxID=126358 RepID=A0ABD1RE32_9LAMI
MDGVPVANGLSFRVGFTGHSGHLRIEPLPPVERPNPLHSLPDFIPPPAFPTETPETIKEYIKEKHLLPRLDEDVFSPENAGRQWEFDWFDRAKTELELSFPRSVVVPTWEMPFRRKKHGPGDERWEPNSVEVDVSELTIGAKDSGALPRIVGPAKDFVRGSINKRPFHPGGLDNTDSLGKILPDGACNGEWVREVLNGGPAQVVPPGFKDGLDFGDLKGHSCTWNVFESQSAEKSVPDMQLNEFSVQFDDLFTKAWEEDVIESVGDGHMSELETEVKELESVKESRQTESEAKELDVAGDVTKGESSVIDQILSVESEKSNVKVG